jgi:hypothetical protein
MSPSEPLPPESAQFAFWVGEWDCTWEGGAGRNTVTREHEGRVILERFREDPPGAFRGTSLSVFTPGIGWRQTWVDDQGNYWAFDGGMEGDDMVLATVESEDGREVRKRMVFTDITPDAFTWRWERSEDDGATWSLTWSIDYRRRDPASVTG